MAQTPSEPPVGGPKDPTQPMTSGGALRAAEGGGEPLHLVLDDIEDYAVFMVSLDGKIASWNSGAHRLKGYTSEEAIGQEFAMLFTPEDIAKGQPSREMEVALKNGVYQGQGKRMRKGGEIFDAEVTLRVVQDAAGQPRGFVKVTRDVTARMRRERELEDRSDFEKQLIGIVSHDLRSPLNAIMLSATMMLRHETLSARQFHSVERILTSSQRALRLIRDLLDFTQARLGGGLAVRRKVFDLHEFVRDVVEEVRLVHPHRSVLVESAGEGTVNWDADRIAQLLTNLLSNALKYGDQDRPMRVSSRDEGQTVTLEVHNWGEPIASGTLPSIFERLIQGNPQSGTSAGSIGLGLFIVHEIVRAHEGTVEVKSSREHGTSFLVRLPRRWPLTPKR